MNIVEGLIVGGVVLGCIGIIVVKLGFAAKGEKGSCKSCGDTCSCVVKDAYQSQDKN